MRGTHLKSFLIAACTAGLVAGANAAPLPVTPAGLGPLTFNAAPDVTEFATFVLPGTGITYIDAATMDAGVQTLDAALIVTPLPVTATVPPAQSSLGMRYNSGGLYIQSRPTTILTNAAGVLLATIQNNTGSSMASFDVSYDFTSPSGPLAVGTDDVIGFRVFYSPTGAPGSWEPIAALSGNDVPGTHSATVTPLSPIANMGIFYLVWADDNDEGSGDPSYTIDNFAITLAGQPPAITQQPVTTTVNEGQVASLSVAASGSGITYQWYSGTPALPTIISGATANILRVTNIMGGARYAWSNPMDSGTYFVRITGTAVLDSSLATVTVTPDATAPAFSYALCGPGAAPNPEQMSLTVSEALNNAGGEVTDSSNWSITTLDGSSTLGITTIAYNDNGTSRTITFDLDPMFPRNPSQGYKINLTASVSDTAKTANSLNGPISIPVLCFTNELLGFTANWQYNDDDVDPVDQLPTTWKDAAYVDTAAPWATGAGPFDAKRNAAGTAGQNCRDATFYGLGNVGTCINLESPVTLTNLITSYYRTHFTFSGSTAGAVLLLEGKFDDGAAAYLNGTEVWRIGLPAGAGHGTFANRTVGDGDAQDALILTGSTSLTSGDNVIAVELHQQSLTSSDLTMGLKVSRLVAEPPASLPVLSISYTGGNVTITSTVAGTLISSTDITAPRATWTSEGPIGAGAPGVTLAATGRKFFAVRVP